MERKVSGDEGESNSISRVNSEPESHPSPSQVTKSLDSGLPFELQTTRFSSFRKMACGKCNVLFRIINSNTCTS